MKASERLRELGEEGAIIVVRLDPTPLHVAGSPTPASVTLRNALPLIADCIEAAERQEREFIGTSAELAAALTALSNVLEGGGE